MVCITLLMDTENVSTTPLLIIERLPKIVMVTAATIVAGLMAIAVDIQTDIQTAAIVGKKIE
jgi:hypothetical protein